jgi:DNA helicase-2/ATP-dependent DNA helicase PcrA
MNHRSPKRVIGLINKIRSAVEDRPQRARSDASEGHVRLFVGRAHGADKEAAEAQTRERMAAIAADPAWRDVQSVKTLTLEHHMAAHRMGFVEMFMALNAVSVYQTGLRDGTLPAVRIFSTQVLPLVQALRKGDKFGIATVLRNHSPLLKQETLKTADVTSQLSKARDASAALAQLTAEGQVPTFGQVLNLISESRLFDVPDVLTPFCGQQNQELPSEASIDEEEHSDKSLIAIAEFLRVPFRQIEPYSQYVSGNAPFDTHQGVKGREFPRVLAIVDDEGARGFTFSYDTLFGAKTPSTRSPSTAAPDGRESSLDRTRRLFYVICSRSQQSLAIVAYSSNPGAVRLRAVTMGWFAENEVEELN